MSEIRVDRPIWDDSTVIYLRDREPDGVFAHVFTREKWKVEKGDSFPPGLTLTETETQALFQELWRVGYRPHNGESSQAHVQAMQEHLQDMRMLVFQREAK